MVALFRVKRTNIRAEIRMIRALILSRESTDNLIVTLKFNKVLLHSMARNPFLVISLSLKYHLNKDLMLENSKLMQDQQSSWKEFWVAMSNCMPMSFSLTRTMQEITMLITIKQSQLCLNLLSQDFKLKRLKDLTKRALIRITKMCSYAQPAKIQVPNKMAERQPSLPNTSAQLRLAKLFVINQQVRVLTFQRVHWKMLQDPKLSMLFVKKLMKMVKRQRSDRMLISHSIIFLIALNLSYSLNS